MGMNLYPVGKYATKDVGTVGFNWSGWETIIDFLKANGLDVSEFKYVNDGDVISADTCRRVADLFEQNWHNTMPHNQLWFKEQPEQWRYLADAGGAEQH